MNTHDVSTSELLKRYGALICPKTGQSYANIHAKGPGDKLRSNWLYFDIRQPLKAIDGCKDPIRTIKPKVTCEQMTRDQWMALWDDAHTNPYEKIVNEYRIRTLNEMNSV